MEKNMSSMDSIIRITVAVIILILAILNVLKGIWLIVLGIMATLSLITAFMNLCPLYRLLGITTVKCVENSKSKEEEKGIEVNK